MLASMRTCKLPEEHVFRAELFSTGAERFDLSKA